MAGGTLLYGPAVWKMRTRREQRDHPHSAGTVTLWPQCITDMYKILYANSWHFLCYLLHAYNTGCGYFQILLQTWLDLDGCLCACEFSCEKWHRTFFHSLLSHMLVLVFRSRKERELKSHNRGITGKSVWSQCNALFCFLNSAHMDGDQWSGLPVCPNRQKSSC